MELPLPNKAVQNRFHKSVEKESSVEIADRSLSNGKVTGAVSCTINARKLFQNRSNSAFNIIKDAEKRRQMFRKPKTPPRSAQLKERKRPMRVRPKTAPAYKNANADAHTIAADVPTLISLTSNPINNENTTDDNNNKSHLKSALFNCSNKNQLIKSVSFNEPDHLVRIISNSKRMLLKEDALNQKCESKDIAADFEKLAVSKLESSLYESYETVTNSSSIEDSRVTETDKLAPQNANVIKEKLCWDIYQKMNARGLQIDFNTIIRGMLTPTEYRQKRGNPTE